MARSNRSIQVARLCGSHPRRQLASVYKKVYFGVETITPPSSKPAIVFSLNEGDDKITLPGVINSKILEYAHWSDIFTLRSLSDNQKREIDGNKKVLSSI
jgi:hypothetical protein